MREEPTPMPENVTRRRFIKRSGGATVGTAIGLYALQTPAWAQGEDDSSEWGMLCTSPPPNYPVGPPVGGQHQVVEIDPVGVWKDYSEANPSILEGHEVPDWVEDDTQVRKIMITQIIADKVKDDPPPVPYNGPEALSWEASVWSAYEVAYGGTTVILWADPDPTQLTRTASASCDTTPGPKEITFTLTPNEQQQDTGPHGTKITTAFKVEQQQQEGLISLEVTGTHRDGGNGDTEVSDCKFEKSEK